MAELDEILAALDEDARKTLEERLAALEDAAAEKRKLELNLRLHTDNALKDKYPRAVAAYREGALILPEDMEAEELTSFLERKEKEYEAVAKLMTPSTESSTSKPDPSAAFAEPPAATPSMPEPAEEAKRKLREAVEKGDLGEIIRNIHRRASVGVSGWHSNFDLVEDLQAEPDLNSVM